MKLRRVLGWAGSLILTAVLLYWFLHKADLGRVWEVARAASLPLLLVTLAGELASILLRAWRLRIMLRAVREKVPFAPILKATVLSYTLTGILPGRLGEVAKPVMLSRWEGLPLAPLAASTLLERAFDLTGLLLLWAGFILWGGQGVSAEGAPALAVLNRIAWIALGGFFAAGVFLWWLTPRRRILDRWARRHPRLQRNPGVQKALRFLLHFTQGLGTFQRKRDIASVTLLSITLWGALAVSCWTVLEAVDIRLPWSSGILLVVFTAFGASIPTPGGVGGVHKLFQYALVTLYAVDEDVAVAAGILGHALLFFPGILWGLGYAAAGGVHLRELRKELQEARPPGDLAEGAPTSVN